MNTILARLITSGVFPVVWLIAVAAVPHAAWTQETSDPLGVLRGQIVNRQIYNAFLAEGLKFKDQKPGLDVADIQQAIRRPSRSSLALPQVVRPQTGFDFPAMARSSVVFGTLYDCGKCDEMHVNPAGGVIVSEDGLCLTNHHVLERRGQDTKVIFAMDYQGRGLPILEVLASNARADVALVRLGGGPFTPAPIAPEDPRPGTSVSVLSHPSAEFYVLTQGVVSRHVTIAVRNLSSEWLEITAPFGAGSSGSGVFNAEGQLVGLVSRIHPLFREPREAREEGPAETSDPRRAPPPYAEMILRRCVTGAAIRACFAAE
jgi:S1-C subfamily serine protease